MNLRTLRFVSVLVPVIAIPVDADCFGQNTGTSSTITDRSLHEWPQLKGNSGFTGLSPDDSVKPPLKLVWSYRLDGDASGDAGAGVIVAGGKVFVPVANSQSIVAIDAENGHFCWEYRDQAIGWNGYIGHTTAPSYDRDRVILWQRRNTSGVMALDAGTGAIAWTQSLSPKGKDVNRGGLPVADGLVYCSEGGPDPAVCAFDTVTGELTWRTKLGNDVGEYAIGPTVAAGRVFVSTRANTRRGPKPDNFRGAITALDSKTGEILWRRQNIYSWGPMACDGEVLACPMWSSPDEKLYLLNCATGKTIWATTRVANHYNPPITFTKDLVLYQPWGPKLHSMSRATGEPQWIFHNEFTSAGCCTPVVSGQYAYIGTSVPRRSGDLESLRGFRLADTPSDTGKYGTVNAIDLSTGKSVWRFPTTNTVCGDAAIAYGRLYFASRDGRVYCCAPAGPDELMTPEARDKTSPADAATVAKLLAAADDQESDSAWPMEGGGPERIGQPGTTLKSSLELAWKFNTQGRVVTSAAISQGVVYSGSESGKIVAVDAKRGQEIWAWDTGQPIRCSPAVAGGIVYCGSDSGILHAIDARTGKPVWQFEAGGPVQASPAIVGGVIVFGANDHNLYALDRRTGRKLWSFRTSRFCFQAPPVIHGDHVFAAGWSDWVWCLDLQTGKPIWRSFVPVSIEAVSYYRDQLWVRSPYYVVRLDPAKGTWLRIAETSYGYGGMAFLGDRLFQSGLLGQYGTIGATSVNLNDGGGPPPKQVAPALKGVKMLVPRPLEGKPQPGSSPKTISARMSSGMVAMRGSPELASMATPLALSDKLCFSTLQGKVMLTDLDGSLLWSYELGGPSHAAPAAASGLLVVGCDDGALYAFRETE